MLADNFQRWRCCAAMLWRQFLRSRCTKLMLLWCYPGNRQLAIYRLVTATRRDLVLLRNCCCVFWQLYLNCRKVFINKDCESFNSNFKDVMNKWTRLLCCCRIGSTTSVSLITLQVISAVSGWRQGGSSPWWWGRCLLLSGHIHSQHLHWTLDTWYIWGNTTIHATHVICWWHNMLLLAYSAIHLPEQWTPIF